MKTAIFYLFIILLILVLSNNLSAQTIRFKLGLNMANMAEKNNDHDYAAELNYKFKPGVYAGFFHEFSYIKPISIETGLAFSMKGFKMKYDEEINGTTVELKSSVNLYYFEVPLNIKISNNVEGTKFYLIAGPYIGAAFVGDIIAEVSYNGKIDKKAKHITIGFDNDDILKVFDFNFGCGFDFDKAQIGLNYGLVIINVENESKNGYST